MLSHRFGLAGATLAKAWGTAEGTRLSKNTCEVQVSCWLSEGIEKIVRHTALESHESATRSIINLILVECLDIIQPIASKKSGLDTEDSKNPTTESMSCSPISSSPLIASRHSSPPPSSTPPAPQGHILQAFGTPLASNTSPLPSTSVATPKSANTTETHIPAPLKLYYEQTLTALVSNRGSSLKAVRVTGIADYVLGYDTGHLRLTEGCAGFVDFGYMVAVEAKRRGAVLSAVPQCLCYMGIMAANRKAARKFNWTISGICSSGTEFLFLRLNNRGKVIRSQIFGLETTADQKALLQVFLTILHAARTSSPRSSPFIDKTKILSNVRAFNQEENDSWVDFNIDDFDALQGVEMDIDNYDLISPNFTPVT